MSIVIKRTVDSRDLVGALAKKILPAGAITKVYGVPKEASSAAVNINVVNNNPGNVTVRIWASLGPPGDVDLIESKLEFKVGAVFVRTNLLLGAGEALYMESDQPDIIVRIDGIENRIQ